jgi:hypothetical protein
VSESGRAAEERFAAATGERTRPGVLTKLRGEQSGSRARRDRLGGREADCRAPWRRCARARAADLDLGAAGPAKRARKLEEELGEIEAGLAAPARASPRRGEGASEATARRLARAERRRARPRHARRAEGLLGERHREALRSASPRRGAARRRPRRAAAVAARGARSAPGSSGSSAGGRRRGRRRRDRRGDARLLAAESELQAR